MFGTYAEAIEILDKLIEKEDHPSYVSALIMAKSEIMKAEASALAAFQRTYGEMISNNPEDIFENLPFDPRNVDTQGN